MANPRLIKKRVNSIKNINKITKALEMVAASKVQKAQEKALSAKPFANKIYELAQGFAAEADPKDVPLMRIPESYSNDLYIIVSTNRGLAGSLNTNLFRYLSAFLLKKTGMNHSFITLGKKGINIALQQGILLADFSDNSPFEISVPSIVNLISESFIKGEIDEVYLVFNEFISALHQEPRIKRLLPVTPQEIIGVDVDSAFMIKDTKEGIELDRAKHTEYNFEPSSEKVLQELMPFYLEIQITEIIYEAEASEHSARMIAMKNASDNANELSYGLSLEYNKARQSAITTEINDIVTASVSLKKNGK